MLVTLISIPNRHGQAIERGYSKAIMLESQYLKQETLIVIPELPYKNAHDIKDRIGVWETHLGCYTK